MRFREIRKNREIREIKPDETKKNINEEEGYKKIKPEKITIDGAKSFFDNLFASMGESE